MNRRIAKYETKQQRTAGKNVSAMYCPVCKSEYVNGAAVCADCGVPLIAELPPSAAPARLLTLRQATVLAMIGISYIFVLRTIGTFLPNLFREATQNIR